MPTAPIDQAEIERRFEHYPPKDDDTMARHVLVRETSRRLARVYAANLPESREKSLAVTALEEALMWANAAIARNQGDV